MIKDNKSKPDKKKEQDYPSSDSSGSDDEVAPISLEEIKKKNVGGRTSVSAEAFGVYHKRSVFTPRVVPKSPDQYKFITERLSKTFMFQSLEDKQRKIVIDAIDVKKFKKGDWVIKQGDDGDVLYIVEDGQLDCFKRFKKDEEPKLVKQYGPSDSFGELALLYNAPRAASIQAKSDCILLALDRETFNNIVKDAEIKRRERFEQALAKVELFQDMDPYERTKLSDVIGVEKYKKGDFIIKQGDEGKTFYILEDGTANATKVLQGKSEAEVVMKYKPGDYFGELALLRNEPRQANVVADSDVSVMTLDRSVFNRVLGPLKGILDRNAKKYEKFM